MNWEGMVSRPYTFSFNLFELFTLLVVVLATSFFVFLCGLYVGRRVQERGNMQEGQAVRLPVIATPDAEVDEPKEPDLSPLTGLPSLETKRREASASSQQLTTDGRLLSEDKATASRQRTASVDKKSLPSKQLREALVSKTDLDESSRRPELNEALVNAQKRVELTEHKQPSPLLMQAKPSQTVSPSGKSAMTQSMPAEGLWGVEVEMTRDEAAASSVARRLRAKEYETYIIRVERHGETWYRVRVGRFASLTQASGTAARLHREGITTQAFIVSE
jgi:cell division septation protein DedD